MPAIGARATVSKCYFGEKEKPGAPTITSSTPGISSLSITFNAPVFNGGLVVTKYEYAVSTDNSIWSEWGFASSGTTPPTSPVTINNLTNGQSYYVKLRAVNPIGFSGESNVWNTTTTPRTTPGAPSLISASRGYRQSTIAFSAPSFNGGSAVTDYQYSTDNGASWSSMSQSTTADYVITGLSDFTTYNIRIRAVNIAGPGAQSNPVSVLTAGVTVSPSSLTASSTGVFESVLTWTAPDNNASDITDYIVQYSTFPTFSPSLTTFADGISATTGTTVTSLGAGTSYYFRVAAVNAVGQSAWSSSVYATTAGVPLQISAPTSSSGDRSFTISWSIPANGGNSITSYSVQYSSNGGSSWSTAEVLSTGSSGFINRTKTWTLANGISYIGRVLATNAVGDGTYSDASIARTPIFAAPVLTANASYNAEAEPGVRRITWSVDPTDIVNSSSSAGTTTRVYLQRMTADNTWSNSTYAEQLIATYTGNATNGSFGTTFTTSGTVARDQQYRIRAEQFSSEDTGYIVGTAWINLAVIGLQSRSVPNVESWRDDGLVTLYTLTGLVDGSSFRATSVGIPGTNSSTVGSEQYSLTSFDISINPRGTASASTTSRYVFIQCSQSSTTSFTTSTNPSHTWPGASNTTTMYYTWDANKASDYNKFVNIPYGNAGAGKVKIVGMGLSNYSTNPDQRLDVTVTAKGNKQTRISTPQPPVTW